MTELDGRPPNPRADALVAIAGPFTSLALGGACLGLTVWTTGLLAAAVGWLAVVNLLLGVFNLLPAAPLDGGRLLRAALWHRRQDWAAANAGAATAGRVVGAVFIALGLTDLLVGDVFGLWLAMIGWFVLANATVEGRLATVDLVGGLTLADIMSPVVMSAPDWWSVERTLDEVAKHPSAHLLPVVSFTGAVTGLISVAELNRVAVHERETTRVRELRLQRVAAALPPATPVGEAMPQLIRGAVAVVDEMQPVGVVTLTGLSRTLRAIERSRRTRSPRPATTAIPALTPTLHDEATTGRRPAS